MPHRTRASQVARVAAVTSSVVLVGLYVAYRSGGQTTLPGSKSFIIKDAATTGPATAPTTAAATAEEFRAIYSSKSAPVFKPGAFGGSKSAAVFHPADAPPLRAAGEGVVIVATQPATTRATTAAANPPTAAPADSAAAPAKPGEAE